MRGGVLSDDIDDSGSRATRIVQVGKTIRQTRPKMQQRGRRLAVHPVPAIGSTGRDPFKKHQHAAQTRILKRRQEVHLRRARIGEAYLDILIQPEWRPNFRLRSIFIPPPGSATAANHFASTRCSAGLSTGLATIPLALWIASKVRTGADIINR